MEDKCGTNVYIDAYVCFKLSNRLFAPYLQTLMLQKRVIHEHTINRKRNLNKTFYCLSLNKDTNDKKETTPSPQTNKSFRMLLAIM